MDFNIGIRVGGQLVPSTTFDASSIYCKDDSYIGLCLSCYCLISNNPSKLKFLMRLQLATLATFGKRRTVKVILIGELGIQKQY